MGNCQAVDIAAITVEYPCGRVERFFLTVPAHQLMTKNPGHFVAVTAVASAVEQSKPFFKLLPADAPLCVGNRYRLISFEEVLLYFSQGGRDVRKERVIDARHIVPRSSPPRLSEASGSSQRRRPAKHHMQKRPV